MRRRLSAWLVLVTFTVNMALPYTAKAQPVTLAPVGKLLTASPGYSLPVLKGLRLNPANPLNIDFIIDTATQGTVSKEEAAVLLRYFLAGLTLPERDIWVNLSPYEPERIAPAKLSQTDLGEDLLAQDYVLKQLAASLTYPESEAGKRYWNAVNTETRSVASLQHNQSSGGRDATPGVSRQGTQSFQKVWIVPDQAVVYEHKQIAVIHTATLKVLTEEDYTAQQNNNVGAGLASARLLRADARPAPTNNSINAFKQHILPLIENDVNHGNNFARLRQIYSAMILAKWFKEKFRKSFYRYYINANNSRGIDTADPQSKEKIYARYLEAFQKGAYDYIKSERVGANGRSPVQKISRRRYFSGGVLVVPPTVSSRAPGAAAVNAEAHDGPWALMRTGRGDGSSPDIGENTPPHDVTREAIAQAYREGRVAAWRDNLRQSRFSLASDLSASGDDVRVGNADMMAARWRITEIADHKLDYRQIKQIIGQVEAHMRLLLAQGTFADFFRVEQVIQEWEASGDFAGRRIRIQPLLDHHPARVSQQRLDESSDLALMEQAADDSEFDVSGIVTYLNTHTSIGLGIFDTVTRKKVFGLLLDSGLARQVDVGAVESIRLMVNPIQEEARLREVLGDVAGRALPVLQSLYRNQRKQSGSTVRATLASIATLENVDVVQTDTVALYREGPLGHARRGLAGNGKAMVISSGLLQRITMHDLRMWRLEEAKHILCPDAEHPVQGEADQVDIFHHNQPLTDRLNTLRAANHEPPAAFEDPYSISGTDDNLAKHIPFVRQVIERHGLIDFPSIAVTGCLIADSPQTDKLNARAQSGDPAMEIFYRQIDQILGLLVQEGYLTTVTRNGELFYLRGAQVAGSTTFTRAEELVEQAWGFVEARVFQADSTVRKLTEPERQALRALLGRLDGAQLRQEQENLGRTIAMYSGRLDQYDADDRQDGRAEQINEQAGTLHVAQVLFATISQLLLTSRDGADEGSVVAENSTVPGGIALANIPLAVKPDCLPQELPGVDRQFFERTPVSIFSLQPLRRLADLAGK